MLLFSVCEGQPGEWAPGKITRAKLCGKLRVLLPHSKIMAQDRVGKTQEHPGHENICIFIIFIKCLLFNPICTLFTRHLGNKGLGAEAPIRPDKQKNYQKRTAKNVVATKMSSPKINPPKQAKVCFPAQSSSGQHLHQCVPGDSTSAADLGELWSADGWSADSE